MGSGGLEAGLRAAREELGRGKGRALSNRPSSGMRVARFPTAPQPGCGSRASPPLPQNWPGRALSNGPSAVRVSRASSPRAGGGSRAAREELGAGRGARLPTAALQRGSAGGAAEESGEKVAPSCEYPGYLSLLLPIPAGVRVLTWVVPLRAGGSEAPRGGGGESGVGLRQE